MGMYFTYGFLCICFVLVIKTIYDEIFKQDE